MSKRSVIVLMRHRHKLLDPISLKHTPLLVVTQTGCIKELREGAYCYIRMRKRRPFVVNLIKSTAMLLHVLYYRYSRLVYHYACSWHLSLLRMLLKCIHACSMFNRLMIITVIQEYQFSCTKCIAIST
jgi:hypothetical protein